MSVAGSSTVRPDPMQDVQRHDPEESDGGDTYITNNYLQTEKPIKVPLPDLFHGDHAKLKQFLMQVDLYIAFNQKKFKTDHSKAMWTSSFLKGTAFNWIETYIEDHLKNYSSNDDLRNEETRKLFDDFEAYKACLEMMFGDIEQERTAERVLFQLKQRSSAAQYQAEFQQYAARTDWDEAALKAQFYRGLKDAVKDELSRMERPETLAKLIEIAVKIDNRNYERTLERKG